MCVEKATVLGALVTELDEEMNITLSVAILNYRIPMSCLMSICGSMMTGPDCNPMLSDCNTSAIQFSAWQGKMVNTSLPILQDTITANIWEKMGGGHDFIFIFDSLGRLQNVCPGLNCESRNSTDVSTADGRAFIKQKLVDVAINPWELCGDVDRSVSNAAVGERWSRISRIWSGGFAGTMLMLCVVVTCCGSGIMFGLRLWRYVRQREGAAKENAMWAKDHLSCFTELPRAEESMTTAAAREGKVLLESNVGLSDEDEGAAVV